MQQRIAVLTGAVLCVALLSGCSGNVTTQGLRFAPGTNVELGSGESLDVVTATDFHPKLTANGAWVKYATAAHARINRTHYPVGSIPDLGVFTDGGGRQHDVYAFFTPNSYPPYMGFSQPDPPVPCTEWLMLNADTGRMLDQSWFRCPPTHFKVDFTPGVKTNRD